MPAQRDWVERRGRQQHQFGAGRVDFLDQPVHAVLIRGESVFAQREVDAVVHPVAGDDDVGELG